MSTEVPVSDSFDDYLKARTAITEKHDTVNPAFAVGDVMPCPVCEKGSLHYTISNRKRGDHVNASCTTDGCVRFTE